MRRPVLVLALALAGCGRARDPGVVVRGTVEAREVTLRSETSGRVVAASCEEGERVREGQELVALDRQELEARLAAAQAGRDAAQARLDLLRSGARPQETAQAHSAVDKARAGARRAEDERARAADLLGVGSISEEKLRGAEARAQIARAELAAAEERLSLLIEGPREEEVRALEANLHEAEAQCALIRVQLDRSVLRAPFAGTVARKSVEVGEVIAAGAPLCTLTDGNDLRVKVYLSEAQLGGVTVDQVVEVRPETAAGKRTTGRVRAIGAAAEFLPKDVETPEDRALQVFAVRVAIDPIPEVKPGTRVAVRFSRDGSPP